jgi:hypothetical protein
LRQRRNDRHVVLYAFDLLELDGQDLRREPLVRRKVLLARLLARARVGQASRENNGYITGSDTPRYDLNPGKAIENAVPFTEIDSWNRQTRARHILMVFDSCFSGTLFQTMGSEEELRRKDLDQNFPSHRGLVLMRINIWIVLGTLLLLLAITRYMQEDRDKERICANEPTASVCHR